MVPFCIPKALFKRPVGRQRSAGYDKPCGRCQNWNHRIFGLLAVTIVSCQANQADAQDGHETAKMLTAAGTVTRIKDGDSYQVDIHLGTLDAGHLHKVALSLTNDSDTTVFVSPTVEICNCIGVDVLSNSIPARGSLAVVVAFRTPVVVAEPHITIPLKLNQGQVPLENEVNAVAEPVSIHLTYFLAGLLSFRDFSHDLQIPGDQAVCAFEIPVTVTAPVLPGNLQVKLSPSLRDVTAEVTGCPTGCMLVVTCGQQAVSDGPISGEVTLHDPVTGRAATTRLTLQKFRRIQLNPGFVRFSRTAQELPGTEAKRQATAVLRIEPVHAPATEQDQPADSSLTGLPEVGCRIGELNLPVRCTRIGKSMRFFRLEVEIDDQLFQSTVKSPPADATQNRAEWTFLIDGEKHLIQSPILFDN